VAILKIETRNLLLVWGIIILIISIFLIFVRAKGLDMVINMQSRNPEHYISIAKEEADAGRYHKAEELIKTALEFDPKNYLARYELGIIKRNLEKYNEAILEFKICQKERPDFVGPYYDAALCYMLLKSYNKAIEQFKFCVQLEPQNPLYINKLGSAYFDSGDYIKAKEHWAKLKNMLPSEDYVYFQMALVEQKLGNVEQAIAEIKEAISYKDKPEYRELLKSLQM